MDITCEKCQSKFKIPDEKIPAGKVVTLPCPKCKEKITVGHPPPQKPAESAPKTNTAARLAGTRAMQRELAARTR